jgi:hypothetical protein
MRCGLGRVELTEARVLDGFPKTSFQSCPGFTLINPTTKSSTHVSSAPRCPALHRAANTACLNVRLLAQRVLLKAKHGCPKMEDWSSVNASKWQVITKRYLISSGCLLLLWRFCRFCSSTKSYTIPTRRDKMKLVARFARQHTLPLLRQQESHRWSVLFSQLDTFSRSL